MAEETGKTLETPESVEENDFPHCPDCGAPLDYYEELEIENDMLYVASGGYDGISVSREWTCPGCDYRE
jgi:rubredoxin